MQALLKNDFPEIIKKMITNDKINTIIKKLYQKQKSIAIIKHAFLLLFRQFIHARQRGAHLDIACTLRADSSILTQKEQYSLQKRGTL